MVKYLALIYLIFSTIGTKRSLAEVDAISSSSKRAIRVRIKMFEIVIVLRKKGLGPQ